MKRGPLSGLGGPFANMSRETQIGIIFVTLTVVAALLVGGVLLVIVSLSRVADVADAPSEDAFPTAEEGQAGELLTPTPGLMATATKDTGFSLFTPIFQPTQAAYQTQVVVGDPRVPQVHTGDFAGRAALDAGLECPELRRDLVPGCRHVLRGIAGKRQGSGQRQDDEMQAVHGDLRANTTARTGIRCLGSGLAD